MHCSAEWCSSMGFQLHSQLPSYGGTIGLVSIAIAYLFGNFLRCPTEESQWIAIVAATDRIGEQLHHLQTLGVPFLGPKLCQIVS